MDTSDSSMYKRRQSEDDRRESFDEPKPVKSAGGWINEVDALRGVFFSFFMARENYERDSSKIDRS